MLDVANLTFTYPNQDNPAIHNINWQAESGSFTLLIGESGSGKSTLLRCLNGLVPHFSGGHISGSVQINGLDVITNGPTRLSQHVGFVGQSPESQAVLDIVEAEIAFALENAAIPASEMHARVNEVLALLGLTKLRQRPLSTLSGGERQKVAIASALALRPKLLLLDEPTSQLDPQAANDLLQAITQLNKAHGLTIVLSEHRLERILPFADTVLSLENGRLSKRDPSSVFRIPYPVQEKANAPRATDNALQITDLTVQLNNQPILNKLSLAVQAGEAVALLGRNGAGKTTLLRAIVNLLPHAAGEIRINGRSIAGRKTADLCREVGYLPQHPDDLLFAETVTEELAITLKNHRLPLDPELITRLLTRLGLADFGDRYPRDLSVGQRQRVALGAITITRPKLLLLDEPTRGLDSAAKAKLVDIWRGWLAEGTALLLVTHDIPLVQALADRVFFIENGQIASGGETFEVLASKIGQSFVTFT